MTGLLVGYCTLGLALWWTNGTYEPGALALALVAFVAVCSAGWRAGPRVPAGVLAGCVLLMLPLPFVYESALMNQPRWFGALLATLHVGAVLVMAPAYVSPRGTDAHRRVAFWLLFALALVARVLVPTASPAPGIDVWIFSQESARHLLDGLSPYSTAVSSAYAHNTAVADVTAYVYPPLDLLLQTVGYALGGDVRWATITADLAGMLLLRRLAQTHGHGARADLLALMWAFHPRGLAVLELAWVEPLLECFFLLAVVLHVAGRLDARSVAYGLFLGLKQFLVFFPFHALMLERRRRHGVLLGVALAVPVVPFLAWDPVGAWQNIVMFQPRTPLRPDSLSLSSWLLDAWGVALPVAWSLGVGTVAAVVTGVAFRRRGLPGFMGAVTITTFALFVLGRQAFLNYYHLVGVLMLAWMATMPADTRDATQARPGGAPP